LVARQLAAAVAISFKIAVGRRSILHSLGPDYEPSVGATIKALRGYWGNETGDPAKVAQVVLKVAEADVLPPHIVLGSDSLLGVRAAERLRADAADRWELVSNSIDLTTQEPIPALPA
jgi:hypothetical protein